MTAPVTLADVEAVLKAKRAERRAANPQLYAGVKTASTQELQTTLQNTLSALASGDLEGREGLAAIDQRDAIAAELRNRGVPTLDQALGLDPRDSLRHKVSWTLKELLTAEFPEPKWIVQELLPVGLSILAGRPKIGKSWLALQLGLSVASGGMFFDRQIEQSRVLYYALEDSPRRIKRRLEKMQSPSEAMLRFEFLTPPLNTDDGRELFWRILDHVRPKLVVLDTLTRCFDASQDWNDVGMVTDSLTMLQWEAQQRDICILCVDHHRKSSAQLERDSVADILGSTAKAAVADTLWGLYRQRGNRETELDITGRDIEDSTLALAFDHVTCCWHCLGHAEGVKRDSLKAHILQAIEDLGGESNTKDLAKHLGVDSGNVSRALGNLVATGHVVRGERIGKYVPYRLP